jgi:acyl-coenzyme A thioesterase PaaI-like protein
MRHAITAAAPPIDPDRDWEPVAPFPGMGTSRSFASGDPTGSRLRIAYFRRRTDAMLVGRAWFGPGTEGVPGHAHGGAVAAVLDEAMGAAVWLRGLPSVAGRLSVEYVEMVPLGTDAIFETTITAIEGRKIATAGKLLDPAGLLLAKSEGLFIQMTEQHKRRLGNGGF